MRKVKILVSGHTDFSNKKRLTYFRCAIVDEQTEQWRRVDTIQFENGTPNRAIILGLTEAIKLLKYPCEITIVTSTLFGYVTQSRHKDLLADLFQARDSLGHNIVEIEPDAYTVKAFFKTHGEPYLRLVKKVKREFNPMMTVEIPKKPPTPPLKR